MEIITSVSIALGLITSYSTLKPFGLTDHFKINTLKLDPSSWIRLAATIVGSAVGKLLAKPGASGEVGEAAARGAIRGEHTRLVVYCIMLLLWCYLQVILPLHALLPPLPPSPYFY